ncbi:MAG: ABC transporter [Caulobacterales bacterium RIFCSPHIGHO2_12_FULL_68_13]|jgi:capsular polysaccharide transport system permease protein|nr:MAG: ABC transporter [Caulobacterales bacterium RIFCSPHIGHO2_12_FULL_68_13]
MMREMITRFGREGFGFLWLVGEPLLFCGGVLIMWSIIKPEYEHGVRLGPFVMTGYMSVLLLRHQISYCLMALQANVGLLHHRQVAPLHLYISRNVLEFVGTTAAFVIVYAALYVLGQVKLPADWLLLYGGWLTTAWLGMGMSLLFAGLALRFEIMERLVPVLMYIMVPISGAFFMVGWLPAHYRDAYLLIPFPHGIEMLRAGVFGEFVPTYFSVVYPLVWGAVLNVFGMALIAASQDRIDVE